MSHLADWCPSITNLIKQILFLKCQFLFSPFLLSRSLTPPLLPSSFIFSLLPSRPVCANAGARLQNGSSNCRVSHQVQSATDQGLIHFHTTPSSHLLHTYIHTYINTHEPPHALQSYTNFKHMHIREERRV